MFEKLLEKAERIKDINEENRLIQHMASLPNEAMRVFHKKPGSITPDQQALLLRVIRSIGYPRNETAIPPLIYFIGDPNLRGWGEAVNTLLDMGPDVIVPHLIQALLDKDQPYHFNSWDRDIVGICCMLRLKRVDPEYAQRCCPTINHLLSQADHYEKPELGPQIHFLLDVAEKGCCTSEYILPTLITLAKKHQNNHLGARAKSLISKYSKRSVTPYTLILR